MSRDLIAYYAEQLPGDRAQLRRDVVVGDQLVAALSGPVGSPAPADVVEHYVRTIDLTKNDN